MERPESASVRGATAAEGRPGTWIPDKKPVLWFLVKFGVLIGLFYAVWLLPPEEHPLVRKVIDETYLSFYARVSGALLDLLGHDITVAGQNIHSPQASVNVVRGCDACEATAIFVAAVLASPVALRSKIPGVLAGVLLLGVTNLARICSLFYVLIHYPSKFDTIHMQVWQPVFVLLAVCLWLVWATWAKHRTAARVKHETATHVPP